jgi:Zn-finger nucleic acid-binding protein
MALAVLRGRSGDALVPRLWSEVGAHPRPGIACPLCRRSSSALMAHGVELDLCRPCQSLWFDADELDRFPVRGEATRLKTVVDTRKRQLSTARHDPDIGNDDSVVGDVVDAVFDILTNWD